MRFSACAAFLASVAVFFGSGCASITGSTAQTISVQTRDRLGKEVIGASCELTNNKGRWVLQTPGSATVVRSNEDMQVLCNKAGQEAGRGSVVSATKGAMWGNIVIGGGVGALIDHNSGAAYEYPSYLQIFMGRAVRIEPDANEHSQADMQSAFAAASANAARTQASAASMTSVDDRLKELKRLHDSGLITREIYLEQQRKIIEAGPAETAREAPPSAEARLGVPEVGTNPARSGVPRAGDQWKYSMRDQKYGHRESYFTARVTAVNGSSVDEMIHFDGTAGIAGASDISSLRFAARAVEDRMLVELSPYLATKGDMTAHSFGMPVGYPIGVSGEQFRLRVESVDQEDIIVPLGSFKTVRVVVSGQRSGTDLAAVAGIRFNPYFVARFRYTAWYAPEVARYVKARHMQWNPGGELTGDDIVQLLEYSKN